MMSLSFPGVVKLLLDRGDVDVNLMLTTKMSWVIPLSVWPLFPTVNDVEAAKLILEREDIDINLPDTTSGWTGLHCACHLGSGSSRSPPGER